MHTITIVVLVALPVVGSIVIPLILYLRSIGSERLQEIAVSVLLDMLLYEVSLPERRKLS